MRIFTIFIKSSETDKTQLSKNNIWRLLPLLLSIDLRKTMIFCMRLDVHLMCMQICQEALSYVPKRYCSLTLDSNQSQESGFEYRNNCKQKTKLSITEVIEIWLLIQNLAFESWVRLQHLAETQCQWAWPKNMINFCPTYWCKLKEKVLV